ncbi:cyclase family protein [Desulfobacter vibrioformis]|uniref:cyclase family protein n=1 Tax=Desulfobacter vibrioformis TaxID=34031 RepID=UPI0014704C8C
MTTKSIPRQWIFLSYPLSKDTPAFGNGNGICIQALKQMDSGYSCNTRCWNLPNHLGTHLDFPRHFIPNWNHATDYNAGFCVFNYS